MVMMYFTMRLSNVKKNNTKQIDNYFWLKKRQSEQGDTYFNFYKLVILDLFHKEQIMQQPNGSR